jgi:hypothetical protein
VGTVQKHLQFLGDDILVSDTTSLPTRLEILLVPGCLVVASVHAPIISPLGYPVPVGFMSTEKEVVKNVHHLLKENLHSYNGERKVKSGLAKALAGSEN